MKPCNAPRATFACMVDPTFQPAAAPRFPDLRALTAVLLGAALAAIDTAIANTALPAIATDLHAPPAASIWVINAYQLAVVATLLPFAALGDRFGPRRIFLGGMVLFTLASLVCTLATSLPALAGARALQGMGGGALMSVNIALIRHIYPPSQLGRGVGLNALVVGVGFAAGPSIASQVLAVASWPRLFAINLPLGVIALVLAWPALPHTELREHAFDPVTAVLAALAFASLILALGSAAQREDLPIVLIPLVLAVGGVVLLLRRQAGHPAPMLPVDLLRRPVFALSALTSMCAFATQGLAFVSLPFYFETVLHRNPVETGFLMVPWAIVVALTAPLAGRLSERHPPGLLGGVGLGILAAGMASLAWMPAQADAMAITWRMALCGAGFGFFQSPNLKALMSSAPPERSGGASGVIAMSRLIGQTSGAAMVALCFGLVGDQGPVWALALGTGFAAAGAALSSARLWAR